MGYRVEELAITSGLNVATIRYYQRLGLLPPPSRQGRIGLYEEHHLLRLREIRRLVDLGFSLGQIGSILSGDDPLAAILIERTEIGETFTREELIEESGLSAELVDLAVKFGLLHPVGGPVGEPVGGPVEEPVGKSVGEPVGESVGGPVGGPVGEPVREAVRENGDSYPRLALEMLRASAALLEEGIDQNALIDLALRYAEHTENTISEAINVFRQAIPTEDGDGNGSEGESEHGREGGEDGREEREGRPGEEIVVREEEREEREGQEEREQLAALTQRILPHVLRLISSHFHLTLLRQIGERAQISAPAPSTAPVPAPAPSPPPTVHTIRGKVSAPDPEPESTPAHVPASASAPAHSSTFTPTFASASAAVSDSPHAHASTSATSAQASVPDSPHQT